MKQLANYFLIAAGFSSCFSDDNYKEDSDNSKLLENILYSRTKAKLAMDILSDENNFIFSDIDEIYFGHTVVNAAIKRGNLNFIDTGCVFKHGKLTLKEVGV